MELPKPLKDSEIRYLITLYRSGDIKARNRIISHNIRIIYSIINNYNFKYLSSEDIYDTALDTIYKAIDKFNLNKEYKFNTYLYNAIMNNIRNMYRKYKTILSIDDYIDDEKEKKYEYFIGTDHSAEDLIINKITYKGMYKAINKLSKKGKQIIVLCYGLYFNEMKDVKVAEILNMKKTHLSRDKKKALIKLKNYLINDEYIDVKTPMNDEDAKKMILRRMKEENININRFRNICNMTPTAIDRLIS